MDQFKYNRNQWLLTLSISLLFLIIMTRYSWIRYDLFQQEGDLAAYDNAIYNSKEGRFMQSSVSASVLNFWPIVGGSQSVEEPINSNYSILGIHFIPSIYITNVLPYFIWPHPKNTLFMQVLGITISALLLLYIFQHLQIPFLISLGIVFSFLFHPANIGALTNAFHPVLMATPLLLVMIIFFFHNKWAWYYIFFALTCGIQENVILTVLAMSFYFLLKKKNYHFLIHLSLSFAVFVLVTKFLIPYFNPKGIMPYENAYGSPLGSSMTEIVINGIKKPLLALQTFFTAEKSLWMFNLLLPFLLLTLLSPINLFIAFIGIGPNLVSNNKAMLLMWGQYNALAMPFLALGAAVGAKKVFNFIQKKNKSTLNFIRLLFSFSIIITLSSWDKFGQQISTISPRRILKNDFSQDFSQPHIQNYQEIFTLIDPTKSLSAPDEFLSKTHQRLHSYIFPVNFPFTEQVVILKNNPYITKNKMDEFLKILNGPKFKLVKENGTLSLYNRVE